MTALFMLTQYFGDLGLKDLVVVAPDAGRVRFEVWRHASGDAPEGQLAASGQLEAGGACA